MDSPWVQLTDPSSGNAFFANTETGVCVWEVPASVPVRPMSQAAKDGGLVLLAL